MINIPPCIEEKNVKSTNIIEGLPVYFMILNVVSVQRTNHEKGETQRREKI